MVYSNTGLPEMRRPTFRQLKTWGEGQSAKAGIGLYTILP